MKSWEDLFIFAFKDTGDNFDNLKTTLSTEELKVKFNDGYGTSEGKDFTAWSDNYVYFPVVYDGAEWVGYVARNVCDTKTKHWGGQ